MSGGNAKGYAVALIFGGSVFLYAGIKGLSITSALQNIVQGKSPLSASLANQWNVTSPATGTPGGSTPAGSITPASGYAYTPGNDNQNAVTLGKYLMSRGLSRAAAAGVCGCVAGEAVPPFNPESVGSGGFGLIGWTGNTSGLPSGYSGPTGNVQADWAAQIAGIVGYIQANGSISDMNANSPDPVSAARYFSAHYERPLVTYSDVRPSVAQLVYANI